VKRSFLFATANPGNVGHVWVKRKFVKPPPEDVDESSEEEPGPYKVWMARRGESMPEDLPLQSRVYVPALPSDNPKLDKAYLANLYSNKDSKFIAAMIHGDWDALDQIDGALWSLSDLEFGRVSVAWWAERSKVHVWKRVLAIDPSLGLAQGDSFGICLASLGVDGYGYVEHTQEFKGVARRTILEAIIKFYWDFGCSELVIEHNHGGVWLVEAVLALDQRVTCVVVNAADGKRARAEPVANLFQLNESTGVRNARMVGFHEDCEKELTTTILDPKVLKEKSPNLLDALVWALWRLMLSKSAPIVDASDRFEDTRGRGRR
jgi:phage terminase large subunit-like protein